MPKEKKVVSQKSKSKKPQGKVSAKQTLDRLKKPSQAPLHQDTESACATDLSKVETQDKKCSCKCSAKKIAFISAIVLIAGFAIIFLCKSGKATIKHAASEKILSSCDTTIFDDIKIKANDDDFLKDSEESCHNEVSEYLKKNIVSGDTIVQVSPERTKGDIQTLLMAKLAGQPGKVYVLSGNQKYLDAIKSNAALNDFESRIFTSVINIFDKGDDKSENPEISSVDGQLPNLQNVNILRINGGYYSEVIEGALNLIQKSPQISIICDYHGSKVIKASVWDKLIQSGFKIYFIQTDGSLKPSKSTEPAKTTYIVFKRK